MDGMLDGVTLAWLRISASPTVGLSLYEDGLELSTRTCCLLAAGASAEKRKTVALTHNGRDYFTAIPATNCQGTVYLASFRWQLGKLNWQQTGEFFYPMMGPWEVETVGEPSENTKAWRFKRSAYKLLEQVFNEKDLVPCGPLAAWMSPSILIHLPPKP
jgi:hypothetical protein